MSIVDRKGVVVLWGYWSSFTVISRIEGTELQVDAEHEAAVVFGTARSCNTDLECSLPTQFPLAEAPAILR